MPLYGRQDAAQMDAQTRSHARTAKGTQADEQSGKCMMLGEGVRRGGQPPSGPGGKPQNISEANRLTKIFNVSVEQPKQTD